ncbi:MAG TPA: mandelate racemase/muconate lactonizing enzyme family protein [candidate division Zixibacteria bacterium]|nr:mandelate racemase/muconate lactonizing enzyme family protein [candidate division Zixibacteria bacterium]
MKITGLEILQLRNIPVTPPLFEQPLRVAARLLRIKTDEGITGTSQIGGFMHSATMAFLRDDLAPFLEGRDPLETERLMHEMLWKFNSRAHGGVWSFAASAVDVALWDIKGKFYKTPVWRLLGGAQKSLPAYVTFGLRAYDPDALIEAARYWVAAGQTRLKIQVGRLDARGRTDPSGAGSSHREESPAEDERRVRAVREAVGEKVELMVDANCLMKYDTALRWCKRLEPYDLMWFEEPIVRNDRALLAELRRRTRIPIAAGQWDGFYTLCDLVRAGAVDFLNIHVLSVGGFTMGMKAAGVAQAFSLPVGNGDQFDLHLHAAVPNGWRAEFHVSNWLLWKTLYKEVPEPVQGWVTLSERPGLGLELNDDAVREYGG